jgi:hypothetical protein
MEALQKNQSTATLSESSIVLIGLLFTIVGLVFRDSLGLTSLLAAIGVGLVVAGTVYITVEGSELIRLSLAFISLVALPLLSYGSVVRWIGAIMIGTVIVGAAYSRISE